MFDRDNIIDEQDLAAVGKRSLGHAQDPGVGTSWLSSSGTKIGSRG